MKSSRIPSGLRLFTVTAIALAICGGCNDDGFIANGGTGGQTVVQENQAPFFQGVGSVVTAGGARVLVAWRPAADDHDAVQDIRYRVYLSGTSDGFDFAAPVATTTPGATDLQLTSADSPLIQVGQEVFVAVRAMDTQGTEDLNAVECAVACADPNRVAYVVPGSVLTGTVGNPLDPYTTIQAGVDSLGSAGGIVIVAGGRYNEMVTLSGQGNTGSRIAVYGAFNPADFVQGVTAQRLLANNDPQFRPTILDGEQLHPATEDEGHFNVFNEGRRTYVGHFTFVDEENEVLLFARSADLVVCGSHFLDPDDAETTIGPSVGIIVAESNTEVTRPGLDVVGCKFEMATYQEDGTRESVAIGVWAPIYRLRVGSCLHENGGHFLMSEAKPSAVGGLDLAFEGNWVTRMAGSPFDVELESAKEGTTDDVTVRFAGNRLVACDSQIYLEGLGYRAEGRKINVLIDRNFIGPIDDYGFEIVWLEYGDDQAVLADEVKFVMKDTAIVQTDSTVVDFEYFRPGENAKVDILFDNISIVQSDDEAFYGSTGRPEAPTYSQDGAVMKTVFSNLTVIGTDGYIDWDQNLFRNGESTATVVNTLAEGITDDGVEFDIYRFGTEVTSYPDDTAKSALHITDNLITMGDDYTGVYVSMDVYGDSTFEMRRNALSTAYYGAELDFEIRGTATVASEGELPGGALNLFVEGNVIDNHYYDYGLDIDFSGSGQGKVFGSISNNRIRAPYTALYFYSSAPVTGQLLIAYNTFVASVESETVEFDTHYGAWSVLFARNLVQGGGDDGEAAFDVDACSCNMESSIVLRNNLVAYSGAGIDDDGSIHTAQIINNTVAFTGQDDGDVPIGSDNDVFSPAYVKNCVTHGNQAHDVPEETVAVHTCLGFTPGFAGYGCIESDPVFAQHGQPTLPNLWFQLADYSPAKDAGDAHPDFNDPDGTRNDLGAFGGPGAGPVGILEKLTDPIPFLVVGMDPIVDLYAGSRFIELSGSLTVVFSQDVDPATVSPATLGFLLNGTPVAGGYAVDGRRVTFTPSAGWPKGANVQMVATAGLATPLGVALDFRHAHWFPTAPASTTSEAEANDSVATAQLLTGSATFAVMGNLTNADDNDFFRVSGVAGARLQASLFGNREGVSGNFKLRLWAPDGTTVLFENHQAMPDGDPFLDFTLPQSGNYYVEVFSGAGYDTARNYELLVRYLQK